jgi:hypothetical protein
MVMEAQWSVPVRQLNSDDGVGTEAGDEVELHWALAHWADDGSLPSGRSPISMAGPSGGAAWLNVQAPRVSSALRPANPPGVW